MRKCLVCNSGIKSDELLIAVYDPKTEFVFFFCSWWHAIKWRLLRRWTR